MKTIACITVASLFYVSPSLSAQDFDVVAAWEKDCQKCHAEDGSGLTKKGRRLRLEDYRKPEVQAKFTDEEMVEAIKEGVEEDGEELMNPYKEDYTDAEIEAFVAYIRSMAS